MIEKYTKKEIVRQFLKFCLVGILNTIIDYGVYLFFSRALGLYFLYANIVSVLVAMTFSFFANKYWTFGNFENKLASQYLKFFLIAIFYFILYNAIFYFSVKYLNVFDLLAKLVAIALGLFWNFFANKYWTFKKDLKLAKN
ncbi:MAG: GtrA family protein [Patescibacteria group bacterium]|nr:GtrA family protein [Patescibacteria group bacterium]